MNILDEQASPDLATLTTDVVSAYVSNNAVRASELPTLIASVSAAFGGLGSPQVPEPEELRPPVPIKKSITPDYLISLEDGRQYKSLKRHLTGRGLMPEQYRAKWGLPATYPMVAPNYSQQRSELAKTIGLGQIRTNARAAAKAAEAEAVAAATEASKPTRRGRKPKVEG